MIQLETQHLLTNDEIVDIILKYIDEDIYNYAIMIDGEWGCGKTYFIKECLMGEIEKHEKAKAEAKKPEDYKARKIIYISLYGTKSTDEISKQVLMKSYMSKMEKVPGVVKTGAKVVGTVLSTAFDVVNSQVGTNLNAEDVSNRIEQLLPTKESILIFDDLERCDCPINEILGYINSYVEQDGLKVILVANQKEIGRSTYQANQELKYMVAAHPNIMFSKNSDSNKVLEQYLVESQQHGTASNQAQTQVQPNLSVIQHRIETLFGQNTLYEQIKEKLVGQIIYYYPDLQGIFRKLISSSNLDSNLQGKLINEIPFLSNI